jgi:hypothetical protein
MTAYASHILIAAIKYLDGSLTGCEGSCTEKKRRQAIYLMLDLLPRATALALWQDRSIYWGRRMPSPGWIDWEMRCREIQRRWTRNT